MTCKIFLSHMLVLDERLFWISKIRFDNVLQTLNTLQHTGIKDILFNGTFSLHQILLIIIWLRRYPTMHHLGMHFRIHVSSVHRIIHQILKYLHAYLVPKYIQWHSMPEWRALQGYYPEWPRVVAILDCTPFQISKPTGIVAFVQYISMTFDWTQIRIIESLDCNNLFYHSM